MNELAGSSTCGSVVKKTTCNGVRSLGWEDPLEKGKATHSRILAWRVPCGRKESDTTQRLSPTQREKKEESITV